MTTYEESKVQLVVNRMDNACYNALSSKSNEEIYIVSSNPSGVVKIDLDAVTMVQADVQSMSSALDLTNSHVSALESRMGEVSASVSALGSSVDAMGSQVSAMASSLSAKRDYLDLTYSTTVPSETIDTSKLVWDDQDPLYNAKLTFVVNDSEAGDENLSWDSNQTCWVDSQIGNFMVWYAAEWGADPSEGKFVLIDGSDVCLQFNLQDGVNVQTFNYTSDNLSSTGTLTMTFTGEPAHVVTDTIALNGEVSSAISSITTTLSSYATQAYVDAQIGAMLSSQL